MPVRSSTLSARAVLALASSLALALPAHAQSSPPPPMPPTVDAEGRVYGDVPPAAIPAPPSMGPGYVQPQYDRAAWEQARADWLDECRANRRHGRRGNAAGGAVVGGVVGGILGNAVAGRGDRTVGTIAGAAVGAVAGGAIGNSADRRRDRYATDYCESYLARYMSYGYSRSGYGYGYGYRPMMVMVPVAMAQPTPQPAPRARECTETQVIEEWVPVAGPARRIIPRRPAPTKRVRVIPDKRITVN